MRPPAGPAALIDPRHEDPLDFFTLDLTGTLWFVARAGKGTTARERADYTLRVLRLNTRDVLTKARSDAYYDFCAHLEAYATQGQRCLASRTRAPAPANRGPPTPYRVARDAAATRQAAAADAALSGGT